MIQPAEVKDTAPFEQNPVAGLVVYGTAFIADKGLGNRRIGIAGKPLRRVQQQLARALSTLGIQWNDFTIRQYRNLATRQWHTD